jgi:hypothetical protein
MLDNVKQKLKDAPPFLLPGFQWPPMPPMPDLIPSIQTVLANAYAAIKAFKWPAWNPLPDLPPYPVWNPLPAFPPYPTWDPLPDLPTWPVWEPLPSLEPVLVPVREKFEELKDTVSSKLKELLWSTSVDLVMTVSTVSTGIETLKNTAKELLINWVLDTGIEMAKGMLSIQNNIKTTVDNISRDFSIGFSIIRMLLLGWLDEMATRFKMDTIKANIQEALGKVKEFWEGHKLEILLVVAAIIAGIVLAFTGLPAAVTGTLATFVTFVGTKLGPIKTGFQAMIDKFPGILEGIGPKLMTVAGRIAEMVKGVFEGLANFAGRTLNSAKSFAKSLTGDNDNKVASIEHFARGGVLDKRSIIQAAENGREAIVPLSGEVMRPFAQAIASELAGVASFEQINRSSPIEERPILYVGTLIADERSLKELERKMEIIRIKEDVRKGG